MSKKNYLFGLALTIIIFSSVTFIVYQILQPSTEAQEQTSLKDRANFPVGVATQTHYLNGNIGDNVTLYKNTLLQNFDSITPEYQLKQNVINPEPRIFDWNASDYLVEYSQNHSLRLFGHTLVWEGSLTEEVKALSPQEFENYTKTWMTAVLNRYKGKIPAYDVVNEGIKWYPGVNFTYRNNTYFQKLGSTYIEEMFRYAHRLDPEALLFYNDFNLYLNDGKVDRVIELLQDFLARDVPIHGIGMQFHFNPTDDVEQAITNAQTAIERIAKLGLKVHLSEVDIVVNNGSYDRYTEDLAWQQAQIVRNTVETYANIPAEQQYGITFWGLRDPESWRTNFYDYPIGPLLFDANYQPKAAYYSFIDGLSG